MVELLTNGVTVMITGRFVLLSLMLIAVFSASGASFRVIYEGNNAADVEINGKKYHVGGDHREVPIDTGFSGFSKIAWTESIKPDRNKDMLQMTDYETNISPVGPLNVGGSFTIIGNGEYRYYFGVDGHGEGTAQPLGPMRTLYY